MSHLKTLRERFEFQEKLNFAHQKLIESYKVQIIAEAINQKDLAEATKIIDKLRSLKGKGIDSFDEAIDKLISDVNKYTGSSTLTAVWQKIKSIAGSKNPVVKALAFSNALESGFKQVPTILKNNVSSDVVTKLGDKSLNDIFGDDEEKKKIAGNALLKAFTPEGPFGEFKTIPYIDKGLLVKDLLDAPLQVLNSIAGIVNAGPQSTSVTGVVQQVQSQEQQQQTTAEPAKQQSKEAEPVNAEEPDDFIAQIKRQMKQRGVKDIDAAIKALEDVGIINY